MTKQFSLAHLTVLGCPPPETTYIAARAGYDFVSFRPIFMGLPDEPNYELAKNKEMMKQTKKALNETGLKLCDIELARIYDGVDLKSYLPAMEVAAELGGRSLVTSFWSPGRNFAIEKYSELCDLAKPFGLTVDVEFVTFADVVNVQETIAVLRSAKRENCGILVDTLHFNRSSVTLQELDAVPREWFHFVHVCDAPGEIPTTKEGLIHIAREERLYPGEGGIDIAAILKRIPEVPYSIELPHVARAKELGFAEYATRCLEMTKAYLTTHGLL